MSRKIVVITGSPRKNGNSMLLADAFIEEVQAKGHTVTRFDAAQLHVNGCIACDSCYKTGKACAFDDDFNTVAAAIEESDAIVFSAPLYWYAFPAQIKTIIDKFYSINAKKHTAGKACALLACCGDKPFSAFSGMLFAYNKTIELLGWRTLGEVFVTAVHDPGDVLKTDGIERVKALAGRV